MGKCHLFKQTAALQVSRDSELTHKRIIQYYGSFKFQKIISSSILALNIILKST